MFDRVDTDAARAAHRRRSPRPSRFPIGLFAAVWVLAVALVSCGGGGDGGVGTNGTGITMGTVNGFGSVIVDGVRFDDRQARVEIEQGASGGDFVLAEVKLGHRSWIESTGSANDTASSLGVAQRIEVEPSLVGVVDSVLGDSITVLGQRVVVNSTGIQQPATVYEGYASISDVRPNDVVEVHALRQGSGAAVTYLATRIENKTAAARVNLRIAGVVAGATGGATGTFKLGTLTVQRTSATLILPARSPATPIANGDSVVVFAPVNAYLTTGSAAPSLAAGAVRVRAVSTPVSASAYLSGLVTQVNVAGKQIAIEGSTVDLSRLAAADYEGTNLATLVVGDYVRARGRFLSGTAFSADKLQLRKCDDDINSPAELRGTVSGFMASTASTPVKFTVRDTLVLVPASATVSGCPAAGTSYNGLFVELKGVVSSSGIKATEVVCKSEAAGSVVERVGTVSSLDKVARTFVLLRSGSGDLKVSYTANTYFRDLPTWANGAAVEVEGVLSGTGSSAVLTALKIKLDR